MKTSLNQPFAAIITDTVIERKSRFRCIGNIDSPARQLELLVNGCFVALGTKVKLSFFNHSGRPVGARTSTAKVSLFMSHRFFHLQGDTIFDFAMLEDFCCPCLKLGMIFVLFGLKVLTVLVASTDLVLYAMLLCAPLYMLHETEEYLFPGAFVEFANRDLYKQDPQTGLLDEKLVYWINMGYIWLPLPVCGLLATYDLRVAAWMPYFLIFQAVVHVGLSIVARRWYNPGLATACLLHVPFAVWAIYLLKDAEVIQSLYSNIYLPIGFIYTLGLPIIGILAMKRYRKRISESVSI